MWCTSICNFGIVLTGGQNHAKSAAMTQIDFAKIEGYGHETLRQTNSIAYSTYYSIRYYHDSSTSLFGRLSKYPNIHHRCWPPKVGVTTSLAPL